MSQITSEAICREIGKRAQVAWSDVAGKVGIGRPQTEVTPPSACVICDQVDRVDGLVGWNRYSYTITVYGRFPRPESGSMEAAKDARVNDLYDEVVTSDGRLVTDASVSLAYLLQMTSVDRRDYVEDGKEFYDIAATFTMQADVPR